MHQGNRRYAAAKTGAIVMAVLVSVCATLLFSFFGLAAWADYSSRGCPDANQCEDAVTVMWLGGLVSFACVMLGVVFVWLIFRADRRRRNGKAIEPQ
ncbi:hypothetical protein CO667_14615 [Rhizobium sp. L43]|nr:hypothetical protein CO667_14615 [Rhizobium sp. L43]